LKQEYIILFTREKKKKKTKQAYKVKQCRLVVVVRSLRRKECGEAQEPRKSSSSRSKWRRRRSSKKREERVASLCALAGNRAASKQEGGPGRGAGKHLRACQCSEEERSDGLGFREE
jgi:hypothetical protein